jgi:hypothetical protein
LWIRDKNVVELCNEDNQLRLKNKKNGWIKGGENISWIKFALNNRKDIMIKWQEKQHKDTKTAQNWVKIEMNKHVDSSN